MPIIPFDGRRIGKPAGSYIADLVALKKAIVLCGLCVHKFDAKRNHYFHEKSMRVQGNCDGCRRFSPQANLCVHESSLGDTWTPRS